MFMALKVPALSASMSRKAIANGEADAMEASLSAGRSGYVAGLSEKGTGVG